MFRMLDQTDYLPNLNVVFLGLLSLPILLVYYQPNLNATNVKVFSCEWNVFHFDWHLFLRGLESQIELRRIYSIEIKLMSVFT